MQKTEVVFGACPVVTPDFAARLAQCASRYAAQVYLERGNTRLCVDSLIGILALDLRRGTKVQVVTEGADERQAMEGVCALLKG